MSHNLLCLHGWGGSKESFTELRQALAGTEIDIHTPDLPGFGDAPEPERAWSVDDYANWVEEYIQEHIIGDYFLLGHSHGGRIAIKLAKRHSQTESCQLKAVSCQHLYLCAAAGIRHPRHFKRIIGLTLSKAGKFLLSIPGLRNLQPLGKKLLYKLIRVHDYEQASPVMKQTLIKVSGEDLRPLLSQVQLPTAIFWGEKDGMTPISDAYIMKEEIQDSILFTFPETTHRVHRDRAEEIAAVIQRDTENG